MQYIQYEKGEKIRIVFLFQVPSFWSSWDSLYEACVSDERFDVKLFWISDAASEPSQMRGAREFLENRNLDYEGYDFERVLRFRPHYTVFQTPYDKGHRTEHAWTAKFVLHGMRVVYIPYGIEISDTKESRYKHFSMSVVLNAFLVYVMSDAIKEEYDKYCINSEAVRALGLPRFDRLIDKGHFRLKEELINQIAGRKVILWKAHFPKVFFENGEKKQATPELKEYIEFSSYIEKHKEIFFIFMPHPKFCDSTIDDELRPVAKRLLNILSELDNVYIDWEEDYRYSLTNADAIIVDRSAVMIEAGAMRVPVLYMYNENYIEPMTQPVAALINSYDQGSHANEMIRFVEMIQQGKDGKGADRQQKVQRYIPYLDGKCKDRIIENLVCELDNRSIIKLPRKLKKNAQVLFFGTGDISDVCRRYLKRHPVCDIIAYIDNDAGKQGHVLDGIPIKAASEISSMEYDYIVIASNLYYREIYLQLKEQIQVEQSKILTYDQFIVLLQDGL